MLRAAQVYLTLGYAVLPLAPGEKRPDPRLAPHGLKDASREPAQVRHWWTAEPRAGLGILPPAEVLVLDVDAPEQVALILERFKLWKAPRQRTPRGGAHLFLRLPAGVGLTATTKALPGVDLRGLGRAYLVAAPTALPSGRYSWEIPLAPPEALPEAPADLLDLLLPPPPPPRPTTWTGGQASPRRLQALLEAYAQAVAATPEGGRHNALIRYSRAAGGLLAHGLDRAEALEVLVEAALRAGLPEREARPAAEWGLKAGEAAPLDLGGYPTGQGFSDITLSEKQNGSWTAKRAFSDKNAWGGGGCRW